MSFSNFSEFLHKFRENGENLDFLDFEVLPPSRPPAAAAAAAAAVAAAALLPPLPLPLLGASAPPRWGVWSATSGRRAAPRGIRSAA